MLVLYNTRFLARQGLPLRGDGLEELSSNFMQLRLQCEECKDNMDAWLEKRTNKYTSPDVQNECLQIMAHHILRGMPARDHSTVTNYSTCVTLSGARWQSAYVQLQSLQGQFAQSDECSIKACIAFL